jgi:hypothetical protein
LPVDDVGKVSRWEMVFHGVNPAYVMLGALVLGGIVVWMYRRVGEELSPGRRYTLAGLRTVFLVLLLGLLLRPVLRMTLESSVRRSILVLLDGSASMSEIKDRRSEADDLKRVAIAKNLLDPAKGLGQPLSGSGQMQQVSRLELVKAVLNNPRMNMLTRLGKEYDIAAYSFDRAVAEIAGVNSSGGGQAWLEKLQAKGAYTTIGDAIEEVISRKRGQPLAGIVLVTDGANNSGVQPLDAATMAGQEKVPLYIYGVGITSPRDIIVSTIFAPEVAFAEDEVPVTIRVRSMGLAGQSAKLLVHLGRSRSRKRSRLARMGSNWLR